MKIVRLDNGTVAEIIPQYATPVEKWYGAAFAALCAEAPDETALEACRALGKALAA